MKSTGYWGGDWLRGMSAQVPHVELKLVVPEHDGRTLGLDSRRALARRVYFLDTPDLDLYRHGVIVRFRDLAHRHDDAVVKLRPVVPGRVPGWLRRHDRFRMEIDALPGSAVCSGALKQRLGRGEVARTLADGRALTKLLSPRQLRLLGMYAPRGVRARDLTVFGPIAVRCASLKLRGLDRGLTAERWTYPDGSGLLELSTKCPAADAPSVARRVSSALRAYGVSPADDQRTKTELALLA